MKIVKDIKPPAGLRRWLFRMPIYVYRLRWGWIFGDRLLLLNHTGRVTGNQHQSVLEVAEHHTDDGSYVVASGWGPGAAWYRNVRKRPMCSIQVIPVKAVPLDADTGADILARYARRRRWAATYVLPRVLGMSVDGSEADFLQVGRRLPFVRFVPLQR